MGHKSKNYILDGLESVIVSLKLMMRVSELRVNLKGLERCIKKLPKVHKERMEKFYGLTGGPNHSKKIGKYSKKDVAFINMYNATLESLQELIRHDHMIMFDEEYAKAVEGIVKKVDKKGIAMSNYNIVSYVTAFFTFIYNGPKMSFELDPLYISGDEMQELIFDKYSMIKELSRKLEPYPNNSINLKLLLNVFEMMDYKDRLIIQKSMGIEITDEQDLDDIPNLSVLKDIRALKEKIFPYGAWNVTIALILGNNDERVDLKEFGMELENVRRDWNKIFGFKKGKAVLQVFKKIRTLDVYNIGGLEFTDPYEPMCLYVGREYIWT